MGLRAAALERQVAAKRVAVRCEATDDRCPEIASVGQRLAGIKQADAIDSGCGLRDRSTWQREHPAAEQCDESPSPHFMISSARWGALSNGTIVLPHAPAATVFRFAF